MEQMFIEEIRSWKIYTNEMIDVTRVIEWKIKLN